MGTSYITNPLEFLIHTLFGLYILAVMLRFLLQTLRADFYNPISQFLVKVTDPVLTPLRRLIPGVAGIDFASIVLLIGLQMLDLGLVLWIQDASLGFLSLLAWALGKLMSLLINVFIFAILIIVIISWINPTTYNPAMSILITLTEPLLRPARRLIPPISGLDLSPLVVLIVLQVLKMLLVPLFLTAV